MKKKITARKLRQNRGIAILCALGVLSVILVIVMLFASKAKVESNVASIHLENQSARTLAKSLVPRIMLTLNKSPDIQDQILYSSIHDESDDNLIKDHRNKNLYTFDWIWKLEHPAYIRFTPTTEGTDSQTEIGTFYYYQTFRKKDAPAFDEKNPYVPTWQYILDVPHPDDEGNVDGNLPTDRKVIARFAFVIIPRVAHLDPNAIANHVHCKRLSADSADKISHTSCNFCAAKLGNSPAELMFMISEGTSDSLALKNTGDGKVSAIPLASAFTDTDSQGWASILDFCAVFGINPPELDASDEEVQDYIDKKDGVTRYLEIDNAGEREAYWSDDGDPDEKDDNGDPKGFDDGVRDPKEFYHRFNLRRTDWEDLDVSKIKEAPLPWSNKEEEEPTVGGSKNHDTGGIAWLANWEDGGDWKNKDDTRDQVIANLLNYCSPPTRPVVSDVKPQNWDTDKPKYTGLKRTLYINECFYDFSVQSTVSRNVTTDGSGNKTTHIDATYSFNATFMVELIDMFLNTLGDNNNNPVSMGKTLNYPDFSKYHPEIFGTIKFTIVNPETNIAVLKEYDIRDILSGKMKRFEDAGDFVKAIPEAKRQFGYYGYHAAADEDKIEFHYSVSGDVSESEVYAKMKISKVSITIDKILLYRTPTDDEDKYVKQGDTSYQYMTIPKRSTDPDNKEYVDCALVDFSYSTYSRGSVEVGDTTGDKLFALCGDMEAVDPRQNLRKEDWYFDINDSRSRKTYLSKATYEAGVADLHSMPTHAYKISVDDHGNPIESEVFVHGTNLILEVNGYGPQQKKRADNSQDCEVATDPSWQLDGGKKIGPSHSDFRKSHISTAFIRHAILREDTNGNIAEFPMESLWELGAIHRGSRWQTLNISKSPRYDSAAGFVKLGAGKYTDGDAPLLDQVKMTNDCISYGKVNLSRHIDTEVRNLVIGALFRDMPVQKDGMYPRQGLDSAGAVSEDQFPNVNFKTIHFRIYDESDPSATTLDSGVQIVTGEQWKKNSYVAALYDTIYGDFGNRNPLRTEKNNYLWRRTDFLAAAKSGGRKGTTMDDILYPIRQNYGDVTDAMEEQIIGRTINLMKVDSTVKGATAILVVQTLKDSGGTDDGSRVTHYRDWSSDGKLEETLTDNAADLILTQHQAGYRRFADVDEDVPAFFQYPKNFSEHIRGRLGTYENGADSITGETKVIITLDFDTTTQKWILVKYEYAD